VFGFASVLFMEMENKLRYFILLIY